MAVTVQNCIDAVRWQVDKQAPNTRIVDADLIPFVDMANKECWDIVVATYEDYYTKLSAESTLTGGATSCTIALATDFYKLRGVQLKSGTLWLDPLPSFESPNRGMVEELSYRLQETTIQFEPIDHCAGTYRYWYVHLPIDLTAVGDTVPDLNGWFKQFIVDTLCVRVLARDEKDTGVYAGFRSQLIERLKSMAHNRDAGRPRRIADARGGIRFTHMTKSGRYVP